LDTLPLTLIARTLLVNVFPLSPMLVVSVARVLVEVAETVCERLVGLLPLLLLLDDDDAASEKRCADLRGRHAGGGTSVRIRSLITRAVYLLVRATPATAPAVSTPATLLHSGSEVMSAILGGSVM
jgi:hypothetical protein